MLLPASLAAIAAEPGAPEPMTVKESVCAKAFGTNGPNANASDPARIVARSFLLFIRARIPDPFVDVPLFDVPLFPSQ
jgi:hypothetical protein